MMETGPLTEMEEHYFLCPYCWQRISVLVDVSVHDQQFIEDCEVCCSPIDIMCQTDFERVICFVAERAQ